jgi:arginyl-tRNA synthetase
MMLPLHDDLKGRIATALRGAWGLDAESLPHVSLAYSPNRAMGDLGTTVAFELARRLRAAPRKIAARSQASSESRQPTRGS